jgi:hypothetical protein
MHALARRVKNRDLETREARRPLKARGKPYWQSIGKGLHLGYRKNQTGGVWVVRRYIGEQAYKLERIAIADDAEDANGENVLDFWQAQEVARGARLIPATAGIGGYTVANAVRDYLSYLETRASYKISKQRFDAFEPRCWRRSVRLTRGCVQRDDSAKALGLVSG